MAQINQHKVVASLPDPLEANSIYYVRVGVGFDQYVTNGSGTIVAYQSNAKLELDGKVDKEEGKMLSSNDYTTAEKNKLASLENFDDSAIQAELANKVDKVAGRGLSDENYTLAEKNKLGGIEAGAQVNSVTSVASKTGAVTLVKADVGLGNVDNTSDANKPISTATATALSGKVDKVSGKQLSTEDYTTAEKNKLSGIEAGAQVNVATNIGQGSRTSTTIPLTSSTGTGTTLPSATTSLAGLQSAADKAKLDGIATGATKNATDAQLRDRSTHTGTQAISTVSGLQTALDAKVDKVTGMDLSEESFTTAEKSKLEGIEPGAQVNVGTNLAMGGSGNSRTITSSTGNSVPVPVATTSAAGFMSTTDKSKLDSLNNVNLIAGSNVSLSGTYPNITISSTNTTYSEISEAEVTAGTASTARAISARRLKFAIDTHGLQIGTTSTTAKAGNWTPTWGDVSGKPTTFTPSAHTHTLSDITDAGSVAGISTNGSTSNYLRGDGTWVTPPNTTYSEITTAEIDAGTASTSRTITGRRMKYALDKKADTVHGHSISDVAGLQAVLDNKADTSYVNTQLDTKVDKTVSVVAGTGLSGGGTLSANRTLSVTYGTTAGTAAQGNDSRLSDSREWTAGTVSQAEAEAGTATTRSAWTAQRVRQAILGWWNGSTDKAKLDGIESGAQVNTVTSVAGKTGAVSLSKSDVGLGSVVNVDATNASNLTSGTVPSARLSGSYSISITGNAATATKLATARTINGVEFDGSSNIEIPTSSGNVPQVTGGSITANLTHLGKSLDVTGNVTIPPNVFSIGDVLMITNNGSTTRSIIPGSGVTLRLSGTTTTGTRSIASWGQVTMRMISNNTWICAGTGLT